MGPKATAFRSLRTETGVLVYASAAQFGDSIRHCEVFPHQAHRLVERNVLQFFGHADVVHPEAQLEQAAGDLVDH
jgi:hypothetical protein